MRKKSSVLSGRYLAWQSEGKRVLIDDPGRFDGVKVIGVDEHVWRHTRRGDKYVTVIIDLTPIRDGTGPARLLDLRVPAQDAAVSIATGYRYLHEGDCPEFS